MLADWTYKNAIVPVIEAGGCAARAVAEGAGCAAEAIADVAQDVFNFLNPF
jgi:hypothetical protein